MNCKICKKEASVSLRAHNAAFCKDCYLRFFRRQVQRGIERCKLFNWQDKILVAISGGKDSLALMLELAEMGYNASGLFIDLGIPGSSDIARQKVEAFCASHGLALEVIELEREGLAIPLVKKLAQRPICALCGKIKRYYFNKAALTGGYAALATGHNLDDEVARLLNNTLRWDIGYLSDQGPYLPGGNGFAARVKPLWRLTEFETANYAFLRGIDCHGAPCPYSRGASFTALKNWMRGLERQMPGRRLDFYNGFLERGQNMFASRSTQSVAPCENCGYPTSAGGLCGVCRIRQTIQQAEIN